MTRRELLFTIPALAVAPRIFAQASKPSIPLRGFNHFTLGVSDVKRSVDFYQGLFGMPIQARQGERVILRIGNGPQFIAIAPAGSASPSIMQTGLAVDTFNADRLVGILAQHGFTKADAIGPMKVRVSDRGGTTELHLGDPDGLLIQLQDASYCGGSGASGNVCRNSEPAPRKGLLAVKEINHFTISVPDAAKTNAFYRSLFGLGIRARQGASAGLGVGPTVGFLMFTGGSGGRGGAAPRPASINHACMSMDTFVPDAVLKTLTSYGITARGDGAGAVAPMKHYISLRMADRGGAREGTPELYFTDPDGLLIQLQDASYCGGGGLLGNVCN
ncbi:MAG TPA: VOC family protein [Vicinamibacterales bacterium]|jgi:catechol 2,3-dioxygenase-like lactoylglutathione lyase family enzyme